MIFTLAVMDSVGHNFQGSWRHPDSRSSEYKKLDLWTHLVRKAEAAKIDAIFFTDQLGMTGTCNGSEDIVLEMAVTVPLGEPSMLISALAQATKNIGLTWTSSIIQHPPFTFARMVSTLDHISDGRVGWNIVTSTNDRAYRAFGFSGVPSHEERYGRADEYLEVVYKLWEESWEDGAVLADRERGIYTDPRKVHSISHHGPRFDVDGYHLMEPSPQRSPVLMQAGGSPIGLDFASRHAEVMFLAAMSPEGAAKQINAVRDLARGYGRTADDILFLQGLSFVIGSTEDEAARKLEEWEGWRSAEGQIAYWTGLTGLDLGQFDPQTRLEDLVDTIPGIRGAFISAINAAPPGVKPTVLNFLTTAFKPHTIAGTPDMIADKIEAFQAVGVDGIQIMSVVMPGSYEEFFEHAVPVLQKRGLMQQDYARGTLREKLFAGRGAHLTATHPAARCRRYT
ncbi:NtaA/DmoA family FMN-dependent monooxygenase [Sphingobium sufflavum]|uniref:NtaA/DmoA family FMN-dependent monooxygenase n=1 Tax=Sphingobium sufflavum TaxID=1129547 RepID=UPI001EEABC4C|nr:NtaA/DmoA family FMN-dependent monooxygenase [Sphingobium sufflavum]MCE7796714.1 NtaA/DmoA family FMN-dependent monooxygenase [Sphingobium sufflavum]